MTTAQGGINRRQFVATATAASLAGVSAGAVLTAAERTRAIGANDRIRIGVIGCGDRGQNALMKGVQKHLQTMNVEFVAVCDPWRVARETANAKVREWHGRDADSSSPTATCCN